MDNRAIGFFDSGLGGLTTIPYLREKLPNERVVYFGDTARTPYGSKTPKTIRAFSREISDFLVSQNVKMIVIACNTVTATCLEDLQSRYDIPVVGIIDPTAELVARTCSPLNRVGVIGTKVTVGSHSYRDHIARYDDEIQIFECACPAIVPLVEEGFIGSDVMDLTLQYYLDAYMLENRLDTLILGCTHYPLVRSAIHRLYPNLRIIDPSEVVIDRVRKQLTETDSLAEAEGEDKPENIFYASDLSDIFVNMIDTIFEHSNEKVAFKSFDID